MVRPILKDVVSADAPDLDPAQFVPDDPDCCCLWVMAFIGPDGEPGHDTYQIGVCTPRWLATEAMGRGYAWGRFYLIVPRWDYDLVRRAIDELLAGLEGLDWQSISDRLARYAMSEFDSAAYHPFDREPAVTTD
jgi:Immunity protein 8